MHRHHDHHDHEERAMRWFARRLRRHGHFGGLDAENADSFGHGMMRPGRVLSQSNLRLAILALLAEKPRHGYELIRAIEERSAGHYSPSPGMVYPTLTYLDEMGYASVEAQGTKNLYALTPEGRAHYEENRQEAEAVLAKLTFLGQTMARMSERFGRRGGSDFADDLSQPLREAVRRLTATLAGRSDATPEEEARILAILNEAIAAIRKS
jgi:DNA-binding PadR family transcriptional regulator